MAITMFVSKPSTLRISVCVLPIHAKLGWAVGAIPITESTSSTWRRLPRHMSKDRGGRGIGNARLTCGRIAIAKKRMIKEMISIVSIASTIATMGVGSIKIVLIGIRTKRKRRAGRGMSGLNLRGMWSARSGSSIWTMTMMGTTTTTTTTVMEMTTIKFNITWGPTAPTKVEASTSDSSPTIPAPISPIPTTGIPPSNLLPALPCPTVPPVSFPRIASPAWSKKIPTVKTTRQTMATAKTTMP
mmetsp:Transcript_24335/g.51349  ORF Transcript_24335/g.51349 Transcript_24335/m.51349 type:complete len:243 (-) Transcript_24335:512-1240(-)